MKSLWNTINRKHWNDSAKFRAYSAIVCSLCGAAGFCLWILVRIWSFNSLGPVLCFIGYPVVAGWIAAILYVYNHPFYNAQSSEKKDSGKYQYILQRV